MYCLCTLLLLIHACWWTGAQNSTEEAPECFDDLDILTEAVKQQNVFLVQKYVLCPNTTFTVGFPAATLDTYEGGSRPLPMRSNSIISCGEDGQSSNNCVVSGGQFNLFSTANALDSTEPEVTNVLIQGVTFEKGKSSGLLFVAPGNVTLEDCIIRNQNNLGAVRLLYEHQNAKFRRSLAENHSELRGMRQTQQASRQLVTFRNCTFAKNAFIPTTDASIDYGILIVTEGDNDAILENCLFINNAFESDDPRIVTSAVAVGAGSTVVLKDNCFSNNTFASLGTVIISNASVLKETNGNFGTVDTSSTCPYIYNEETKECLGSFESDTCKSHNLSSEFPPPSNTPLTEMPSEPMVLSDTTDSDTQAENSESTTKCLSESTLIGLAIIAVVGW